MFFIYCTMGSMNLLNERRGRLVELLRATAGGDEPAFTELHQLTHTYLHHVALRILGSSAQADEVLQEAYVTIWIQAHRFDAELGSAMTWLITVVRNHALSALRSQRLERHSISLAEHPTVIEDAVAQDGDDGDPIRQAFYATLRSRLPAALDQLEPAQRQSIALTYGRGMAHAEVSQHMAAPLGTVKSWLRRGMARLAENLAPAPVPVPGFPTNRPTKREEARKC